MTQLQTHKGKQMMKELQNHNHQINSGIWDLEATKISIKLQVCVTVCNTCNRSHSFHWLTTKPPTHTQ